MYKDVYAFSDLTDSTQNTSYSRLFVCHVCIYKCLYNTRILPHALNGKEAKNETRKQIKEHIFCSCSAHINNKSFYSTPEEVRDSQRKIAGCLDGS